MNLNYKVQDDKYKTLKDLLKNYFDVSERFIARLKREHRLIVNNKEVYINYLLNINDEICINIDFDEGCDNIIPTQMDLGILYEDEAILVVDKQQGFAVHPSQNHYTDSLSNGIKFYFDKIGLKRKIRPINRLDKDTFGIVIFAKSDYIHECFIKQMKNKTYIKKYIGIVDGILDKKEGIIDAPICRVCGSIIEREVNKNGEKAVTIFRVLEEYKNTSLVEFILGTGRTHQIRVHMAQIGYPLVGDTVYSNGKNPFGVERSNVT